MSYESILLTAQDSNNILLLMTLGAFITSFLIIRILLKTTQNRYVIFWYFGTSLIYFLLFLVLYFIDLSSGVYLAFTFVEFVLMILVVTTIWPFILLLFPAAASLALSFGTTPALKIGDFLLVAFALFIPQLCSLLIIKIAYAKGIFQKERGTIDYEVQNPI